MWGAFRMLYESFKKDCIDYFPGMIGECISTAFNVITEMLTPFCYMIRSGIDVIVANREILDMFFDMAKTVKLCQNNRLNLKGLCRCGSSTTAAKRSSGTRPS